MAESAPDRRIAPRISLTDAVAAIERGVDPVEPHTVELSASFGLTLASDAAVASAGGAGEKIRLAGARLRRIDIALLAGAGVERVDVRVPKFMFAPTEHEGFEATCAMVTGVIASEGGIAAVGASLEDALKESEADAVIAVGNEAATRALQKSGRIEFDGVAVSPGGTIAFGNVAGRPVLLLPGRFDAALAAWLVLGRRLLARLAFRLIEEQPYLLELARPIASPRGLAEVIPVRRRAAQVEPLADDGWRPQVVARADGWILVPAESEGLAAGTKVQMRAWP